MVSSFDGYAACWGPFCHGVSKYWPDCPYDLYFVVNEKTPPCGKAIPVRPDKGWAKNLREALQHVTTPYVLYAQEDYWINRPVNSALIADYVRLMERGEADYIRLHPVPGPDKEFPNDNRLGILADDAEYRTSLQMALWRKSVLADLVDPEESPWQFEVEGSRRSRKYGERFLCVNRRQYGVSYVFTAIVDGEWTNEARRYAETEGLAVEFSSLRKKPWRTLLVGSVRKPVYRLKRRLYKALERLQHPDKS